MHFSIEVVSTTLRKSLSQCDFTAQLPWHTKIAIKCLLPGRGQDANLAKPNRYNQGSELYLKQVRHCGMPGASWEASLQAQDGDGASTSAAIAPLYYEAVRCCRGYRAAQLAVSTLVQQYQPMTGKPHLSGSHLHNLCVTVSFNVSCCGNR